MKLAMTAYSKVRGFATTKGHVIIVWRATTNNHHMHEKSTMLMAFLAIIICIKFLPQICTFEHRPPYASAMHSTEDIAHARS